MQCCRVKYATSASGKGSSLLQSSSGPSGSATAVATSELVNGEFMSEMKKIIVKDRLAEIMLADHKGVKNFEF
jgi:hypothetical protein